MTTNLGLPPYDILERNAGGLETTAMILAELYGNVEAAYEEFRHGERKVVKG